MNIDVVKGKFIIAHADHSRKRFELPFTEEFLLESLDVRNAHADELPVLQAGEFDQ
jgi:hypothetical protein